MEEEIDYLVTAFDLNVIELINGNKLYSIKSSDKTIYILNSGVGKVNAAITTAMMLSTYQIDKLISIGTSGALTDKTKIGDFINGKRLAYHDVDVTAFGYQYGQLPRQGLYFKTTDDRFWQSLIEKFNSEQKIAIHDGDIVTGDQFINSNEQKKQIITNFPQGMCAEMESTAIVHTAERFKIDTYVLRSISDLADGEADITFDEYLVRVCQNYKLFIELLISHE